jgi:uncharacterized metal-binding protein YceD (DUF177 family)
MKVHLRQIPQGETIHLEGEEDASPLGLEEVGASPAGPLEYALDVGVSGGGLFATGRLALKVKHTCVCCLEEFEREIEVEDFAAQVDYAGSEMVDLTPAIREDIHLLLPPHPRCDRGGGTTVCPAALDGAPRASRQASAKSASAWDALDKLKQISD